MKINPIYKKELKISARSKKTALILLGYNTLLAIFGLFAFYITFDSAIQNGRDVDYSDMLRIYSIIAGIGFGLVLLIVPALTAGSISGEREKQTLEILLTTKESTLGIVLGKLASSISVILLLAFSGLPILSLVFAIGGVTFLNLCQFILLIFVTAIFVGSIGVFFSVLLKKTTASTVTTYSAILILIVVTFAILLAIYTIIGLKQGNKYEGIFTEYENASLGNTIFLLLINPAITFFTMLREQVGDQAPVLYLIDSSTNAGSNFILNNWFYVSLITQAIISVFLMAGAAKLLDPLSKRPSKSHKTK